MSDLEPIEFTIGNEDFNTFILPENAWAVGSDEFKNAVRTFYTEQFAPTGGSVDIKFDEQNIHVRWTPSHVSENPFAYAINLLQKGELRKATPLLTTFLASDPDDLDVLYNLGMALSDLGELDKAKEHLSHLIKLSPQHTNGLVALGVAQQRAGESEQAIMSFKRAIKSDPRNSYAQRNLGGVLGALGRYKDAELHLRAAVRLQPSDQAAVYGLAQCLEDSGNEENLAEADKLYRQVVEQNSFNQIAELARTARSRIAQRHFQEAGVEGVRHDAMFYCLGALEQFAKMSPGEVQRVAFEIAMLGRSGLDVNDSTAKYTLNSLPGKFSGLHLVSIMYVGFKQIAPELDGGFDLSREYAAAQQLFSAKNQAP